MSEDQKKGGGAVGNKPEIDPKVQQQAKEATQNCQKVDYGGGLKGEFCYPSGGFSVDAGKGGRGK